MGNGKETMVIEIREIISKCLYIDDKKRSGCD